MMNLIKIKKYLNKTNTSIINSDTYLSDCVTNYETAYFDMDNFSHQFLFNGIKVILCSNTNYFISKLTNTNNNTINLYINNRVVKKSDCVIIDHFTKVDDVIFNKANEPLFNLLRNSDIDKISSKYEEFICKEFMQINIPEMHELVDLVFDKISINNAIKIKEEYVNNENIENIFKIIANGCTSKKLIILNNFHIDSNLLLKFFKNIDFLFITSESKYIPIDNVLLQNLLIWDETSEDKVLEIPDKNKFIEFIKNRHNY